MLFKGIYNFVFHQTFPILMFTILKLNRPLIEVETLI
jgi:hypothetical protein